VSRGVDGGFQAEAPPPPPLGGEALLAKLCAEYGKLLLVPDASARPKTATTDLEVDGVIENNFARLDDITALVDSVCCPVRRAIPGSLRVSERPRWWCRRRSLTLTR
jgi:hypothetical protein